jgi:serine/threonine-protein kinase ATR
LLAELLELSTPDFLRMIQREALPWLVLRGKQEVIQEIAEARMEQASWQPCLDKNNLGPIIALLLIQNVPDVEAHAMTLLRHISPHFEGFTLGDLILVEPVLISLELLKAAGEAEEDRKAHVSGIVYRNGFLLTRGPDTERFRSHGWLLLLCHR